MKTFTPLGVRKHIVYSLAYNHLHYVITIFGKSSSFWQAKVDSILNVILRNVRYSLTPSNLDFFQTQSMPNFQSLFCRTVLLNHNWNDEFKYLRPAQRNLRMVSRYLVPSWYNRYGKNMRSF